jgi:hypothetical protein
MNPEQMPVTVEASQRSGRGCLLMVLTFFVALPVLFIIFMIAGAISSKNGGQMNPGIFAPICLGIIAAIHQGIKALLDKLGV